MKCIIPEISWHNRDPVLSVDIQPVNNVDFYRLASGGTDCHVLVWFLKVRKNGGVDVDIVSDLTKHQRSVNVVRWSPTGQYLATGDDDSNIIIWHLKTDNIPLLEGETNDKETWIVTKVLRGHREDVYDICWSPNGLKLLSGSIDNTAIIWDFNKGHNDVILSDHKGFVQGVTWDPKGQYVATLSSDRICRIYDNTGNKIKSRTHKGILPVSKSHSLYNKEVKYFHDDTFKSYFRRLTFSPDGNLLITPSGCVEGDDSRHATFVFALECLAQPVAILPSPKQFTIVAKCCPIFFELRPDGAEPMVVLPYRLVIAVGTVSDIVLYDTQQTAPFAHFQNVHYTRITDLTWAPDGLMLVASSTDGFCTVITFEPKELGVEYVKENSENEESVLDISGCEELEKPEVKKVKEEKEKVKKPNLLEKWTVRKSKGAEIDKSTKSLADKAPQVPTPATKSSLSVQSTTSQPTTTRKRIAPIKVGEVEKRPKVEPDNIPIFNKEVIDDVILITDSPDKSDVAKVKSKPLLQYFNIIKTKPQNVNKKNEGPEIIKIEDDPDPVLKSKSEFPVETKTDTRKITLEIDNKHGEKPMNENVPEANKMVTKTIKRIPLITLSSPKRKK